MILKIIRILSLMVLPVAMFGQHKPFISHPDQLGNKSYASWIGPGSQEGVFYFRKHFYLEASPENFIIHVSADNRYRLYVNGNALSWGPAVGDLNNWNYETVDIGPSLKKGRNVIAAQVWNQGKLAGARQITHQTAFILQGETEKEQIVNTNASWLVHRDKGYNFIAISREIAGGGYIAAATDSIDGRLHPWNWEKINFDDKEWMQAHDLGQGNHTGLDTWIGTPWLLKKREIPVMEQSLERIPGLLYVKGMNYDLSQYSGSLKITVPPNQHIEILMDRQELTMGFPRLLVTGGRNSKIKIQYQEALFDRKGEKGNRAHWQGKEMKGYYDIFLPDGGTRVFEPLWIRVFRYVKISIDTEEEPLAINDFHNIFTAYPFRQEGSFQSDNDTLQTIWDVSWRTVRLCALESYMDCPYYEQLQYIGDARIQALISMYVAGDDRLARNAIQQLYGSMQPMGLTKSNHPSSGIQIIPPFSLLFIGMMHDYFMLQNDAEFLKPFLPGVRFILDWFIGRIEETGMMGPLPYWNHIDGGTGFRNGSPPGISDGGSAHMSILLAQSLIHAAEMMEHQGFECEAEKYRKHSESLKQNTYRLCFVSAKNLIAETPSKELFSQHTNSIAILAGLFDPKTEQVVGDLILSDTSLIKATLYFNFYVFQALKKAGMGDRIISQMDKWQEFLDFGFTSFPEHGLESRSDCHAWSAHPMYDFLNITCGIESKGVGFNEVEIRPQPGSLSKVIGEIPHPLGRISVKYSKDDAGRIQCSIKLPEGLTGKLILNEKSFPLSGGKNEYSLK